MSDKNKKASPNDAPKKKKIKSPHRGKRILASILIVITLIGCAGVGVVGAYAASQIVNAPDISSEDFLSTTSSVFYASDGVTEFHNTGLKQRENIAYDDLSNSLIDALISIEDSRFFAHDGFDVPRFTSAAFSNLLNTVRTGSLNFGQGGSTFTMQLIKNSLFVSDGSDGEEIKQAQGGSDGISRKVQEIYLSQKIENEGILSKKMILEMYLNKIDFGVGRNIVGVENSAQAYFGKSASDVNIVESAFLAGVINAPYAYSPYSSIQKANERTQTVLYQMHNHGYINDTEYQLAKNVRVEDLLVSNTGSTAVGLPYQAFIDTATREIKTLTGKDPSQVGMKVYTTMDLDVQSGIDKVQARSIPSMDFNTISADGKSNIQVGSTVVDNKTGEIVGTFGGYDYNQQLQFNRGTDLPKPPASTLKPVISYAPAYDYLGWATDHVLTDGPIELNGLLMINYDNQYKGQIDLNEAIGDSRNIPALLAFNEVYSKIGHDAYAKLLTDNGLDIGLDRNGREAFSWTHATGVDPFYATTAQMAGATATLFNGGEHNTPHTIRRIEFTDGSEPFVPDRTPTRVYSPGASYMVTRGMRYVVDSGLNPYTNPLRKSYPVFGKTGTNQWDKDSAAAVGVPPYSQRDRLMIAATSDFTISTWVGFDTHGEGEKAYFSSAEANFNVPAKLNSYLLDILQKKFGTPTELTVPDDVTQIKHIKGPFPYQSPLPDMDPSLVSTGYILKEYAKLESAEKSSLKDLAEQKVEASADGLKLNLKVSLSEYPDADKLTVAPNTIEMPNPRGGTVTGRRIYDETWIYGAVRYKTVVLADGNVISEQVTETNAQEFDVVVPAGTKTLEVKSSYTYEKAKNIESGSKSSTVDVSAMKEEVMVTIPDFKGKNIREAESWANTHKVQYNPVYVVDNSKPFGTIIDVKPDKTGQITEEELQKLQFQFTVSDQLIKAGQNAQQFLNSYKSLLKLEVNGEVKNDSIIEAFRINGNVVQEFKISDNLQNTIEVIIK